jgi:hypothetical protein
MEGQARAGVGVSLLFLVYPGFNQHWAAYLYSHFYIVLFFFLFSLLCMLLAIERPRQFWAWTAAGLFFSALNLWMMEYFYVLELGRVGLILTAIRDERLSLSQRLKRTLSLWLPYLVVFTLAVLSRLFVFNNQVYGISLTSQLRSAPLETLIALVRNIKFTIELVLRDAWLKSFELPQIANVRRYCLPITSWWELQRSSQPQVSCSCREKKKNLSAKTFWMRSGCSGWAR